MTKLIHLFLGRSTSGTTCREQVQNNSYTYMCMRTEHQSRVGDL